MIASEWPFVYPFAVSRKLPPRSRNASRMRFASSGSEPQPHSLPKVIVPRQSGLTRRPEWPMVT